MFSRLPIVRSFYACTKETHSKMALALICVMELARQAMWIVGLAMQQVDVGHVFRDRRNVLVIWGLASPDLGCV
jgi:hypothetical protein